MRKGCSHGLRIVSMSLANSVFISCSSASLLRRREALKQQQEKKKAAAKKPAKKVSGNYNPVKAGLRARKQAAEQQRKQRKQYFHDKAVSAAIERSRQQKEEQ